MGSTSRSTKPPYVRLRTAGKYVEQFANEQPVDDFPDFYVKYGSVDLVRKRANVLVNLIIDDAPIEGGRKYISVDVKVQRLQVGETTCIPGWHCDTISDPDAMHHLFILGRSRTEFNVNGVVWPIPVGYWASYGSSVEHRGPIVKDDETRLLVRLTESNTVRPKRRVLADYPWRYYGNRIERIR